jgi:mannobiose 2-epimerase
VLGIKPVILEAEQLAVRMAGVTLKEGIAADGSIYNEGVAGNVTDTDRHWWPQAEAIVGFVNAFEIGGNDQFIIAASNVWEFIRSHMRHPSGEWWWQVNNEYQPDQSQDLAGEWKCPYHNTRCCIEVMKRVSRYHENRNSTSTN